MDKLDPTKMTQEERNVYVVMRLHQLSSEMHALQAGVAEVKAILDERKFMIESFVNPRLDAMERRQRFLEKITVSVGPVVLGVLVFGNELIDFIKRFVKP